jgi:membrane protein required for colicin V production
MNLLDLTVIGVIALSAIFAFARGFVREALSIVAWIGAGLITLYLFSWACAQVEPHIHNLLLSQVIAGFGLFVISLIILTMLTGVVARMVHLAGLTPIDRTLGFIFGLVRGAFLVCLAYLLLDLSVQRNDRPQWIQEAKSEPYLQEGADLLRGILPESLKIKGTEAIDHTMRSIPPAAEAQRAMRALVQPAPAAPPPQADTPSTPPPPQVPTYRPGDQKQLDRLIGTQR